MAEIAKSSSIASHDELDTFRLPPTQGTVSKMEFVDKRTITSNPNSNPLEFTIPESGQNFIDLYNSRLEIKLRLKNGEADLAATDKVGPINILLQSLFSQVDIFMNNTRVTDAGTNYSYKAYIPIMLSYGTEVKETWLTSQLFSKDEIVMDATSGTGNKGFNDRSEYTKNSQIVHLIGPLYSDIWQIQKWIAPGITLKISLWRNNNRFVLMTTEKNKKYRIEITEAKLVVNYVGLQQQAYLAYEAALSLSPAKYPLDRKSVV